MTSHQSQKHDHDLGFAHDLPKLLGRRAFLALTGGAGFTALSAGSATAACVALPWETAGPYPGDGSNRKSGQIVNVLTQEGVLREDIRVSFGELTGVADGLPLELEIKLMDADRCVPLPGAAIYIWHCDSVGRYSLYDDTDVNFLRGVGVADENGIVKFTTIVPGCYDGRWPHIHFEVFESIDAAVDGSASVLTAQIALPEAEMAAVYAAHPAYSNGVRNLGRISLERDGVFSDNTDEELTQQMMAMNGGPEAGYSGTVAVPIDFSTDQTSMRRPRRG